MIRIDDLHNLSSQPPVIEVSQSFNCNSWMVSATCISFRWNQLKPMKCLSNQVTLGYNNDSLRLLAWNFHLHDLGRIRSSKAQPLKAVVSAVCMPWLGSSSNAGTPPAPPNAPAAEPRPQFANRRACLSTCSLCQRRYKDSLCPRQCLEVGVQRRW